MIGLIVVATLLAAVLWYLIKSSKLKQPTPYPVKLSILQREVALTDGTYQRKHSNHTYRGGSRKNSQNRISMKNFTNILSFDPKKKLLELEANVKVCDVIEFLLKKGYNLSACPDLKELTLAGLVCGVGGGNTSHLQGYFHNQVVECDIIFPGGKVETVKSSDLLFKCIPFTLGTMGYLTRIVVKVRKAKPFVESHNIRFDNYNDFYDAITNVEPEYTFCDSTIYSSTEFVLVKGKYVSKIPPSHSLTNVVNKDVYYEEIRKPGKEIMYMKTYDWIYRFSTDLYYTTMELPSFLKSKTLRQMIPRKMIEPVQRMIGTFMPVNIENICQDVLIPAEKAKEFFVWYDENISLYPLYNVPVKSPVQTSIFWPDTVHFIDFGVGYGILPKNEAPSTTHDMCRSIETKMLSLGGRKLPYTDTHLSEELFWKKVFGSKNKKLYEKMRAKYKCSNFPTVYDKIKSKHIVI